MKPIIWNEIFNNRLFWTVYNQQEEELFTYYEMWLRYLDIYREDESGNEELNIEDLPEDIKVRVSFPEQFALEWNPIYWNDQIYLIHPNKAEPILLGWYDGHYHNEVFRVGEFEAIINCAQNQWTSEFDIKYFPLLLYKYTWVTTDRELSILQNRFDREWRKLGIFTEEDLEIFSWAFLQIYPTTWAKTEQYGWLCEGGYSLRDLKFGNREVSLALNDFFSVIDSCNGR